VLRLCTSSVIRRLSDKGFIYDNFSKKLGVSLTYESWVMANGLRK